MPDQTNLKQAAHQKLIDEIFAGIEANVIGPVPEDIRRYGGILRGVVAEKKDCLERLKLEKEKWL